VWQDYAIAAVVLAFTLTTIPMIRDRTRLPFWTTFPMVMGGLILVVAYATLNLWFAFSVEVASVLLWTILLRRTFKHADDRTHHH
jgi:hypothetical protein